MNDLQALRFILKGLLERKLIVKKGDTYVEATNFDKYGGKENGEE